MLDLLSKELINQYQRGMPLCARPYAEMAERLGVSEAEVLASLQVLQDEGLVSRIGPIFDHGQAGASTLAAMKVPAHDILCTAEIINSYAAVNHNYEREHDFNLWFVLTAPDQSSLTQTIEQLEVESGYAILNLPMQQSYHIDLAFPIEWSTAS